MAWIWDDMGSKSTSANSSTTGRFLATGGLFACPLVIWTSDDFVRSAAFNLWSKQWCAARYDKQLLPKAMQLRRGEFGKKGQVGSPAR